MIQPLRRLPKLVEGTFDHKLPLLLPISDTDLLRLGGNVDFELVIPENEELLAITAAEPFVTFDIEILDGSSVNTT